MSKHILPRKPGMHYRHIRSGSEYVMDSNYFLVGLKNGNIYKDYVLLKQTWEIYDSQTTESS